ncbi:MAG: transketolase [Proteobacteria bacterium]|nr:transketolase [Pseudomonadota bacterium]
MNAEAKELDLEVVACLKGLVIDAVDRAQSGHPGGAMSSMDFAYLLFSEFMHWNPSDSKYFGRDRFVLSAGHESMLLYALFYATGWLLREDLESFRQFGSKTPGHPENFITPGVECTTGPLGQGAGMSVGFAIASAHQSAVAGALFSTYTWCLLGDGCMQEGVTLSAASLAGHLQLGDLIWFYDKNRVQISGHIDRVTSDDHEQMFRGLGWQVITLADGHDHEQLRKAMAAAKACKTQPTLIIAHTVMAKGSKSLEGSAKAHGSPFSAEEKHATKDLLGIPKKEEFYFPEHIRKHFMRNFSTLKAQSQERLNALQQWLENHENRMLYNSYFKAPDLSQLCTIDWSVSKPLATRAAFGTILAKWADDLPHLMGGSADLEPSNMTLEFKEKVGDFSSSHRLGRSIAFGVREFPMACIANGMALYGGITPFIATFLVFSDYLRPALRLSAIQKVRVIYEFTHDSFYVGEDGPTHQPVEHVMSLRAMPGVYVMRPADAFETEALFKQALTLDAPSCFMLTRQKLKPLASEITLPENYGKQARFGGWVVKEADLSFGNASLCFVFYATGSEVILALQVAKLLEDFTLSSGRRVNVKVVSLPCWELFFEQPKMYRRSVLSRDCPRKVAFEAGSTLGWRDFVGPRGLVIGVDKFGHSAPQESLAEHFGFVPSMIKERILNHFSYV